MKRHGFTIWELLAVLVITAVVAAILFPVFHKARECARCNYSCQSNEKQIGLGLLQYTQDNDECLPDIAVANPNTTWRALIQPYTHSKDLFLCPDRDDKEKTLGPDGYPRSYAANSAGITYSGNRTDQGDGVFAGQDSKPVNWVDLITPEHLIMLCEVSRHSTPDFNIDNLATFNPTSRTLWAGHVFPYRSGRFGSNYLMADGHVKLLRPMDTQAMWHRNHAIPLSPAAIAILQNAQDRAGK